MNGLAPGRPATRRRLWLGAGLVALVSVANLLPVSLGVLGAPWPLALLWAAHGWTGLGPNAMTGALLFALGLWLDVLTGATPGSWALVALATHLGTFAQQRFLGVGAFGRMGAIAASAAICLGAMALASAIGAVSFGWEAAMLPLIAAVALHPVTADLFAFEEEEA